MKKNSNLRYILENFEIDAGNFEWLNCIETFFGTEKAEEFGRYFIQKRNILRKNDIRKLIKSHSLSIYSFSQNEHIAFINLFKPIDGNNDLLKKMENGFKKTQKLYRMKNLKLADSIKKYGYSYSTIEMNWKDVNKRDTYQRECIFAIYSEQESDEQFKSNIVKLAREYNVKSIIITERFQGNFEKLKIKSELFDIVEEKIIEIFDDTTIDTIEQWLSKLCNTKVYYKIPYERNKTILQYDSKQILDYYSKWKQEIIRKTPVTSFNMGMIKNYLLNEFKKDNSK